MTRQRRNAPCALLPISFEQGEAFQFDSSEEDLVVIDVYTLKRWPGLLRYAASDTLPIDNNPVENAIRPIAISRKNSMFAGLERAGRRTAAIQSLLGTAQLNGLDPLR